MATQAQTELQRGQNRAKRAIADSIADEIGALNVPLNKLSGQIKDVCATLSSNWEGAAADALIMSVRDIAEQVAELSAQSKTLATAIKSAALSAYPN